MPKHTLWIVPPQDIKARLHDVVSDLSGRYGGPDFEPHVTLLGDVEMERDEFIAKAHEVAEKLKPFRIQSSEVSFSTTYFQSVFVRMKASAELMQANLIAKEIMGVKNNVFMPHISLLYGDHDMQTRQEAIKSVQLDDFEFACDSLVVTPSTMDPRDWQHLKEIKFPHQSKNF